MLVNCGAVVAVSSAAEPTLVSINTLTGATEDQPFIITHEMLVAEAVGFSDADGDPLRFRIESITTGTLVTRNAPPSSPGTLNPVTPGTVLVPGKALVWTPAANAFNNQLAFKVRAWDNTSPSSLDVQVTVQVTGVPDIPTLTSIATLNIGTEDTRVIITRAALLPPVSDANDVDGILGNFKVMTVLSGTLGVRAINATGAPTPVDPGVTILTGLNELVWDPPANANGVSSVCTLVAHSTDGQSSTGVPLKIQVAAVNDPIVASLLPAPVDYSLKVSGYAQIFSDSLAITDQDGEPTLRTGSNYLRITAAIAVNRVANEDSMELRSTEKCKLVRRGVNYDIRWLSATGTVVADVSTADDGSLSMVTTDGAVTVATSGSPPVGRAAVVAELLKTINYTNQAGRFATITKPTRQVEVKVVEGHPDTMLGGQAAVTFTSVITLLPSNDPPSIVPFKPVVVSPGGIAPIVFPADEDGNVSDFDQQTANQNLTISINTIPNGGEVIDLVTKQRIVSSFSGSRLMPNSTAGIGYRNTKPNFASDGFTLRIVDAGGLGTVSNVLVRIDSNLTGEARIVSDPLLVMNRGASTEHPLTFAGPTGGEITLWVTRMNGQPYTPSPVTFTVPSEFEADENGTAQATMNVHSPAMGEYLEFMLNCQIGTSTTKQPFLIRLMPVVPLAASN